MRAILDLKIRKITLNILYTVAVAIANTIPKNKLREDNIIPKINNKTLQKKITSILQKLNTKEKKSR